MPIRQSRDGFHRSMLGAHSHGSWSSSLNLFHLAAMQLALAAAHTMGSIIKTYVFYPRAFWREQGLSGMLVCSGGPITVAFDDSGENCEHPAIMARVASLQHMKSC